MIHVQVSRPLLSAVIYATVRKRDGSFKTNLRIRQTENILFLLHEVDKLSESERQFEDRDSVRD